MTNLFRNSGLIFVGAACASLAISASAQTNYSSVASPTSTFYNFGNGGSGGGTEVGNQIVVTQGGPLSSFTFNYYALASSSKWTAQITFYNNDGVPFNGYNEPKTVIGQSTTFTLTAPAGNYASETLTPADFTGQINLPTEFTWTLKISGASASDSVGLNFFGAPTIGNAFNDYWVNTASGWLLETNNVAIGNNTFGAIVTVPEPTSLALAVFGGIGLLVVARRFRK